MKVVIEQKFLIFVPTLPLISDETVLYKFREGLAFSPTKTSSTGNWIGILHFFLIMGLTISFPINKNNKELDATAIVP